MLAAIVMLVASTGLQYAAAVLAIRLMRVTGRKWAWGLVAVGIALMAVRRSVLLYRAFQGDPNALDLSLKTFELLTSMCLFAGLAGIAPLFRAFGQSQEELRMAQAELERRVRDRTAELAAANEDLQQERYLLHTLMDYLPHNIYFKDAQSRFIRVNKSMARYFGLQDPSEAIGKTDLDYFTDEHALQALADEQEILRTGQGIIDKEEKETWPDGAPPGLPARSCRCLTMRETSSAPSAFPRTSRHRSGWRRLCGRRKRRPKPPTGPRAPSWPT